MGGVRDRREEPPLDGRDPDPHLVGHRAQPLYLRLSSVISETLFREMVLPCGPGFERNDMTRSCVPKGRGPVGPPRELPDGCISIAAFPSALFGEYYDANGAKAVVSTWKIEQGSFVYTPVCLSGDGDNYTLTKTSLHDPKKADDDPTEATMVYQDGPPATIEISSLVSTYESGTVTYTKGKNPKGSSSGITTGISIVALIFFLWWIMRDM